MQIFGLSTVLILLEPVNNPWRYLFFIIYTWPLTCQTDSFPSSPFSLNLEEAAEQE